MDRFDRWRLSSKFVLRCYVDKWYDNYYDEKVAMQELLHMRWDEKTQTVTELWGPLLHCKFKGCFSVSRHWMLIDLKWDGGTDRIIEVWCRSRTCKLWGGTRSLVRRKRHLYGEKRVLGRHFKMVLHRVGGSSFWNFSTVEDQCARHAPFFAKDIADPM